MEKEYRIVKHRNGDYSVQSRRSQGAFDFDWTPEVHPGPPSVIYTCLDHAIRFKEYLEGTEVEEVICVGPSPKID